MRWLVLVSVASLGPMLGCSDRVSSTATDASDGSSSADPSSSTTGAATTDGPPQSACELIPDPGTCEAAFDRWYFDPATGRCALFSWGGCDGVVPFEDFASCSVACESCEVQLEEPDAAPVTITIRNASATTIYLESSQPTGGGDWTTQEYVLTGDVDAAPLHVHPDPCEAESRCSALVDDAACFGCDPGMPMRPGAIRLEPGATWEARAWDGRVWSERTVTKTCLAPTCQEFFGGGDDVVCPTPLPYMGSLVTATARASTTLDGDDCTPDPAGVCHTGTGATPVDPTLTATAEVVLPSATIELTFE